MCMIRALPYLIPQKPVEQGDHAGISPDQVTLINNEAAKEARQTKTLSTFKVTI